MVQILYERVELLVVLHIQQIPFKLIVITPLKELTELAAHKEKLLAGHCHIVTQKRAVSVELILIAAEHLVYKRVLAVHNLVVRKRQNKVLAVRVHHNERQKSVVVLSEIRIHRHITQRVVHPAHIPFVVKAQAVIVGRSRYHRPSR